MDDRLLKRETLDSLDVRSPSPGWSTLPEKRARPSNTDGRASSPKLSDKFRVPLPLFDRKRPPSPTLPPLPRLLTSKPRIQLFTPSQPKQQAPILDVKPRYVLPGKKIPQFRPFVGAREEISQAVLHEIPDRQPLKHSMTRYGQPQTPQFRPNLRRPQQAEETETDWTQAWKKGSTSTNNEPGRDFYDAPDSYSYARQHHVPAANHHRTNGRTIAL